MTLESEPIRNNNPTPDTEEKPEKQAKQANADVPVTPSVPTSPPPKTHCQITCKTEKNFWDNFKTVAEIVGIALLAVYTFYTIKMYCANKEAANAATTAAKATQESVGLQRKQYQATFRASVDLDKNWMGLYRSPQNRQIWTGVKVLNFGKNDATSVFIDVTLEFRDSDPTTGEWNFSIAKAQPYYVVPPTSYAYTRTLSPITKLMEKQISPGDENRRLYVWGRIFYKDFMGDLPYTDFCQYALAKDILNSQTTAYPSGQIGYAGPYNQCN
jgi:hypothetical protein